MMQQNTALRALPSIVYLFYRILPVFPYEPDGMDGNPFEDSADLDLFVDVCDGHVFQLTINNDTINNKELFNYK